MPKPNLLIYGHYYPPDVAATGQLLKELAEGLLSDFNVSVICTVPSYTGKIPAKYRRHKYFHENMGEVRLLRIRVPEFRKDFMPSRLYNISSYFFSAISATFQLGDVDVVFAISQPPILGGLLGRMGKRIKKAKLVYNIQDFNPEQSQAVGVGSSKLTYKVFRKMDTDTCKASDLITVVGRDMEGTLKDRFQSGDVPRYICIQNWARERELLPLSKEHEKVVSFLEKNNLKGKFILMYSGNLGLYYDLENILPVIALALKKNSDAVFCLVGDGSVKQKLEKIVKERDYQNVRFLPYQQREELMYSLNAANAHLVVSAKGIRGVSVPSKLYGVMAVGKPILGVLEEGSEGYLTIEEAACGLLSAPGDLDSLKNNITQMLDSEAEQKLHQMGEKGREYLLSHITMEGQVKKYRQALKSVLS
ncbi:MAG: glycosyltransferase family 4 protein [Lachnospiraceae bacterium]|nr:glycosyltransferase family 4 protein [Lachnospiraceae bacterium]